MASLELSRRELLAAFLGASVAQQACRRSGRGAPFPGELVDRSVGVGHLLRGGERPPTAREFEAVDVAIVGAGVAGLSAAWRLAAAGVESFRVVELEDVAGGTSKSGRNAVSAFPWGAHYLPAPLDTIGPTPRLLREMGLVTGSDEAGVPQYAEEALLAEPEERVFYKGHWYEGLYLRAGASDQDLEELRRFDARMAEFAALRDGKGRKAFAVPTARSSDDAELTALDRTSMAQWLEANGFRSPRLKWMVDYACRDDFGGRAEHVSAWAAIWYFAARNEGEGRRNAGYLTWPEGNGRLVRHFVESIGARRVLRERLVHTVEPRGAGWRIHGIDARTRAPFGLEARQVVLAAPRFIAARILAPWRTARPQFLDAFAYSPWVVANLTVKHLPPGRGFPTAWDNVFYESESLGYVVSGHQATRAHSEGPTVLTWYYPLVDADPVKARERLLSQDYAGWEQIVRADFSLPHPTLGEQVTRLEVHRWGHAMVRPSPGFIWGGARQKAQESLSGTLHFAHSDLGGMGLFEEANWFGVVAAERALRGLGRNAETWL